VPAWRHLAGAVAAGGAVRLGYRRPDEGAALLTRWADELAAT
jgi:hypothetical protein